jgi:SAM-dependent methyltransferase
MAVDQAQRALEANPSWYHTLELAPGVVTEGQVDLRKVAPKLLPDDLGGLRALDIGTFDGFWAFELERRGAQVVAADVESIDDAEWPPLNRERLNADVERHGVDLGLGFRLAKEALDSHVERVICNVYDLEPDKIGGPVDVAFLGTILLHLRDPVRALERIHGVLKPGGRLFQIEPFSVSHSLIAPRKPRAEFRPLVSNFNWWFPNLATVMAMPRAAGFVDTRRRGFYKPPGPMNAGRYVGVESRRP